jgi:hypothetical protein
MLMRHGRGEALYDHHSCHDKPDAEQRGGIQALSVEEPTDHRHERDADSRPYGIRDTEGERAEREGEEGEGGGVSCKDDERREQPRETVSRFAHRRGHHLRDDGGPEIQPVPMPLDLQPWIDKTF